MIQLPQFRMSRGKSSRILEVFLRWDKQLVVMALQNVTALGCSTASQKEARTTFDVSVNIGHQFP